MADRLPTSSNTDGNYGGSFNVDPRFIDLKPLGFGGSGVVFSAIDSDCDKAVALKKLSFFDKKSCKYALREMKIMRRLKHENVVTVYEILGPNGYELTSHSIINCNELTSLYLVQELLDTDLLQLIQCQVLTDEHVKLFLYQLIRGLMYIHSANVVHRDLKPSNLLINIEDLVLKIGDFGLARVVDMEYSHKGYLTDGVGTCWYRSPELIISPRDYTKAIDMWSVGCIFAEMMTGKPLFSGANEMDQIGKILDAMQLNDNEWNKLTQILPTSVLRNRSKMPKSTLRTKFKHLSTDALDLLEKLLVFSPDKRISAEDALDHPYLSQYRCPEDEPSVLKSFHIENEVDDLSPKTLRRMLGSEIMDPVLPCGSTYDQNKMTKSASTDSVQSKNSKNRSQSGSSESLTDMIDNKLCDITQELQLIGKDQVHDKNLSLLSNKELNLQVIVNLPDEDQEENKKEQLSPKEDKQEHLSSDVKCHVKHVKLIPVNHCQARKDISKTEVPECKEEEADSMTSTETWQEHISVGDHSNDFSIFDDKLLKIPNKTHKNTIIRRKIVHQKEKDKLNEEKRAESPRDIFQRLEKNKMNSERNGSSEIRQRSRQKPKSECYKEGKMKKNKKSKYREVTDRPQDFDSMYRLPTEHLSQRQVKRSEERLNKVESQLKLHEHLNSKLKLAELEKDRCIGAMGGCQLPPVSMESGDDMSLAMKEDREPRSRSSSGSSGTESNFNQDFQRRFEH